MTMISDLRFVQSTPRRRAATMMLPSTASPSFAARQPVQGNPPLDGSDHGITITAQGPLRHPKPLTPSDLHSALEKEQEAIVNRLTRELSLLRQQTASVASTTSSTSMNESADVNTYFSSLPGSTHSLTSRRQRSLSSLSAASVHQASSVTGIAPARSREPSIKSPRPSVESLSSSYMQHPYPEHLPHYGNSPSIYPHRNSASQVQLGPSSNAIARYEEANLHKSELETVRHENEQLRRRVRELEQFLKSQKEGST
ncbi:hypothetical protein N7495_000179 [Penicillium taxi]|uniref:uncharacterized protein n=1 Tax=Penicillium taxi TaxID=168475 RepID=UPI0025456047|nr:uncharacterized protein N7495_000179 [Penicillium taxi]KAJ5907497.1 hypothetical protein N7495_000179 [Penicillium taxi]